MVLEHLEWGQHGESSLTRGLLNNVPLEIELLGYGRLSNPESEEDPLILLNGENLNPQPISDLDLFFRRLYSYYCGKGLWCIIIKWMVELLTLGFTICFSGFFLLYVDWNGLRNAKCGMDAVESGIKPCDLAREALHQKPLTPLTVSKVIIIGHLGLFSIYWFFCFLRFFAQLKDILGTRLFYHNSLGITDAEIQTVTWEIILEKIVSVQSSQMLCVVKDLSAHDVIMRLMRKENYLIAMLNKGVLSFQVSRWFPGVGPCVKFSSNGKKHRLILTKPLEWTLNWCILEAMFDRNFCIRKDFVGDAKTIKNRLVIIGLVMLLLSPFLVIFMVVYLFLRHAEQFYNHPATASSRRWSNLAKWLFREFNEVDHLFMHRINGSVLHASEYLKQYPAPIVSIIAKFISFVSGGFAAILLMIAFLEESLLEGHIFGRNLFWYAAVFGTVTAISRAAVADELLIRDHEGTMSMVVRYTHYMPKRWRGKVNTEKVRKEFESLFQYTGIILLEEMASIFLTPFLLLFVVPKRVDDILQFILDFTVDINGVGHVCSYSTFDFDRHGNSNYGSANNAPRMQRSSQGKMEKSFMSFQSSYSSWEPSSHGKQFLSNLRMLKDQWQPCQRSRHICCCCCSSTTPQQGAPSVSGQLPHDFQCYRFDSSWMTAASQRKHPPYLLDRFYASRSPARNHCMPAVEEQQSQLGSSTSSPFFQESLLQLHDSSAILPSTGISGNHHHPWWARSRPPSHTQMDTSFPEPPDFTQFKPTNSRHNFSDTSSDDQDESLGWVGSGRLPRAAYLDYDLELGGSLQLHFDDVYHEPP